MRVRVRVRRGQESGEWRWVQQRVSEVGKWERAADIRIWPGRRMQAGSTMDGVQLRPASRSRRRAQRETTRKCGLCTSSLATRLRIDRIIRRSAPARVQCVLVVCQLVHKAAVYIATACGQILFHTLPAHARQCQLARYLLTCVCRSRRNLNRRHHQGVSLRSNRPSSLLPCLHQ